VDEPAIAISESPQIGEAQLAIPTDPEHLLMRSSELKIGSFLSVLRKPTDAHDQANKHQA
jgi:hypothetical protein